MKNVEINARSKKVALIGLIIVLVVAIAAGTVGTMVAAKGSLEACTNVGVAALKAQLMDLSVQSPSIKLVVNKVYAKKSVDTLDLSKGDETALKSILGTKDSKTITSAKAKALVYIEYTATVEDTGEAVGGNKFLAYICKDDVAYVLNNADAEGKTIVSQKDADSRESLIIYQNSGLAEVEYLKMTKPADASPVDFPSDLAEWTELDAPTLTEYIRRKS